MVHRGLATPVVAQVALTAVLAATLGLGTAGRLAGLGYGMLLASLVGLGRARHGAHRLGPADRVTLVRAVLVGGVAALVADSLAGPVPMAALLTLTVVALVLDNVDGRVARRTGTASRFGARFDEEVDAFLILVLSVEVARTAGAWVLAIGLLRYAYLAAERLLPWLRGPLPPRYWGKVVAATQGVVLAVVLSGLLPARPAEVLLAAALVALAESFAHSVRWRWAHRERVEGRVGDAAQLGARTAVSAAD